jgi:hypothetical protein
MDGSDVVESTPHQSKVGLNDTIRQQVIRAWVDTMEFKPKKPTGLVVHDRLNYIGFTPDCILQPRGHIADGVLVQPTDDTQTLIMVHLVNKMITKIPTSVLDTIQFGMHVTNCERGVVLVCNKRTYHDGWLKDGVPSDMIKATNVVVESDWWANYELAARLIYDNHLAWFYTPTPLSVTAEATLKLCAEVIVGTHTAKLKRGRQNASKRAPRTKKKKKKHNLNKSS